MCTHAHTHNSRLHIHARSHALSHIRPRTANEGCREPGLPHFPAAQGRSGGGTGCSRARGEPTSRGPGPCDPTASLHPATPSWRATYSSSSTRSATSAPPRTSCTSSWTASTAPCPGTAAGPGPHKGNTAPGWTPWRPVSDHEGRQGPQ